MNYNFEHMSSFVRQEEIPQPVWEGVVLAMLGTRRGDDRKEGRGGDVIILSRWNL